ncbi:MAG: YkvA family protein [Alphaproteobacteria bacterium]|nr:YkvA family protein [Alphaproteobacteria bacterium]
MENKGVKSWRRFWREIVASWRCFQDPATPFRVKASVLGALAYFIMPIDLIPDFLLILGYTDDAAALWVAWRALRGHITDKHRDRAAQIRSAPNRE